MKILWVSHPTNPKKNETEEHVAAEAGKTAITFGYAKLVQADPRPPAPGDGASRGSSTPVPWFNTVQWKCDKLLASDQLVIIKRFQSSTLWYSKPPADCPPSVAAEFERRSKEIPVGVRNEAQLENAKVAQAHADFEAQKRYY